MARYRFIEEREIIEDSVETSKDTTDNKHECSEIKQETIEQSLTRLFTVRRLREK